MPEETVEQKVLKAGCNNFENWGWRSTAPALEYQPVKCPEEFVNVMKGAFGKNGVQPLKPPIKLIPLWPWILLGTTACVCLLAGTFLGIRANVMRKQRKVRLL